MKISNQQWQSLYRYSSLLCGNQNDALDLLHSAIDRLLRVKPTAVLEPEAYLRKVIRNLQYERWREEKTAHRALDAENPFDGASSPEYSLEDVVIERKNLNTIWQDLSPQHKDLLYLWAWLGLSVQEMADELNLPKANLLIDLNQLQRQLMTAQPITSDSLRAVQ